MKTCMSLEMWGDNWEGEQGDNWEGERRDNWERELIYSPLRYHWMQHFIVYFKSKSINEQHIEKSSPTNNTWVIDMQQCSKMTNIYITIAHVNTAKIAKF